MRRTDAFGLLGLLLLLAGVSLYFSASAERMSGWYWLVGPLLWYGGFALIIGWGFVRFSRAQRREQPTTRQVSSEADITKMPKER